MPLFDDYRKMAMQLQEQMPKVALAIARKVAGHALDAKCPGRDREMALRCLRNHDAKNPKSPSPCMKAWPTR